MQKLEDKLRAGSDDYLTVFAISDQDWDSGRQAYPDEAEVPCELFTSRGNTSFFQEGMSLAGLRVACAENGVRLVVLPSTMTIADIWADSKTMLDNGALGL